MIYAIQGLDRTPVKIGHSGDERSLASRIKSLQTAHPYPLRIIHSSEGSVVDERQIHERLHAHRLLGEWFEWCAPVEAFLRWWRIRGLEVAMVNWDEDADTSEYGSELYISESAATVFFRIKSGVLRDARLAGGAPPFKEITSRGHQQRYYRISDVRQWLREKNISFHVSWHSFARVFNQTLRRAEDFQ